MAKFNSYTDILDISLWHEICRREGTLTRFGKGEYLVRKGDRLRRWGFIEKGYFKYEATDEEGDTHITGFAFCNELIGDYLSIVGTEPVKTDIMAAVTSYVLICDIAVIARIFEERPTTRLIFAESLFRQAYIRYLELHIKSPQERYMTLLKRCPRILQDISLKELASFLRITPTHLSRIRRKLTFTE